ncbi:hypothetical protein NPIL_325141, partial [Nephila pilipes]
ASPAITLPLPCPDSPPCSSAMLINITNTSSCTIIVRPLKVIHLVQPESGYGLFPNGVRIILKTIDCRPCTFENV